MVTGLFFISEAAGQTNNKSKKANNSLDFGVLLGGSNYIGELTKGFAPVIGETRPAGGLIIRYNLSPAFTLRGSALYGRVQGTDKNFNNDAYKKRRNLSFRSDIIEFSGQVEWNILGYENTKTSYGWSPYLFAGIGVFRYNPKAQFLYNPLLHDASLAGQDKEWIELQPLGTEGQETTKFNDKRRYSLTQLSFPIGAGVKFQLDDNWAIGLEFGLRKTFTDYIDDISTVYIDDQIVGGAGGFMATALKDRSQEVNQEKFANNEARGNSKKKDWYMIAGVTLTYRILGGKTTCFNF
ncbi:MAG: outer membrane beta-barrel protein [Bacteroidia bacterium]|nr:outer membrane beta-barrel protein [Bacteroidia bacterium]